MKCNLKVGILVLVTNKGLNFLSNLFFGKAGWGTVEYVAPTASPR